MMAIIRSGISAVFGDLPIAFWLAVVGLAAAGLWHISEVRQARELARMELKAAIDAEAARTGRQADAATRNVLACRGVWNREAGRCEP
jgi:predicted aconitase